MAHPTSTSTADLPLHVEPHVNERGHGWVEVSVTGQDAIDLARAITQRLAGQGIVGRTTEPIVTLIAGAIHDHPVEMTAQECEDLGQHLIDEAQHAASPEFIEAVLSA